MSTGNAQGGLSIKAMTPEVIEARLTYRRPAPDEVEKMERLNRLFVELGREIGKLCPEGMMKSKAVTDLVQLRMTANAAVCGDGIPAGSLAGMRLTPAEVIGDSAAGHASTMVGGEGERPPKPGPDYVWDNLLNGWRQMGLTGPAINPNPVGA